MSQDLFAAFGESEVPKNVPPAGSSPNPAEGVAEDDDFGDFEGASVASIPQTKPAEPTKSGSRSFTPKAPTKDDNPIFYNVSTSHQAPKTTAPTQTDPKDKKIGQHPFAGHMDFLFEAGDDEYDAGADELGDLSNNPEAAMAYSKRIIAEQEEAARKQPKGKSPPAKPVSTTTRAPERTPRPPNKLKKKSGYAPARDPNVLFDADDVSEDEAEDEFGDFGDFEGGENDVTNTSSRPEFARPQVQNSMPAIDLLGLDAAPQTILNTSIHGNGSSAERTRSSGALMNSKKPTTARVQQSAQQPDVEREDDGWDDFEVAAPSSQTPEVDATAVSPPAVPSLKEIVAPSKSNDPLPPTNVPPPVVLLSIFQSLFAAADDALFNALGKLDLKQKQMLLAHPASHQFLKGYLGHCTVLAHIIAGRKLRWKRDQHLSQSMRIGPAAAGGKGGMKLAGVDKSEIAKEDREVVDTLRLWKVQVGKLRSAVVAASAAPGLPKLPSVPEISESAISVKTLKQDEGAVSAPHACALCGLKREERAARVDREVEDSFGEWWVQGMGMHLSCLRFWEEFEGKLKSR